MNKEWIAFGIGRYALKISKNKRARHVWHALSPYLGGIVYKILLYRCSPA